MKFKLLIVKGKYSIFKSPHIASLTKFMQWIIPVQSWSMNLSSIAFGHVIIRQEWVKAADDGLTGHPVLALLLGPVHLRQHQWRSYLHHLHIDGMYPHGSSTAELQPTGSYAQWRRCRGYCRTDNDGKIARQCWVSVDDTCGSTVVSRFAAIHHPLCQATPAAITPAARATWFPQWVQESRLRLPYCSQLHVLLGHVLAP